MTNTPEIANFEIKEIQKGYLEVFFKGAWLIQEKPPEWELIENSIIKNDVSLLKSLDIDVSQVQVWDSSLLIILTQCQDFCRSKGIEMNINKLPLGMHKILELSATGARAVDVPMPTIWKGFLPNLGLLAIEGWKEFKDHIQFLGEIILSFFKLVKGQASMRLKDFFYVIEEAGIKSLGIVSLIAFLVGVIIAFVGIIQLRQFGADIYVANLVGIAMTREMGAVMSAVILTGKIGASYAAYLGTMKVTEEIDALKTLGISPVDFLVLPRVLSLLIMMPLLCIYADFLGMFGGYVVSMNMLDISTMQYINQTRDAVNMNHFSVGIIKSLAFGIIVAFTGCLRGMKCGSSSSAVGVAATQAVVYGITYIVIADALFTFIFNVLDI